MQKNILTKNKENSALNFLKINGVKFPKGTGGI